MAVPAAIASGDLVRELKTCIRSTGSLSAPAASTTPVIHPLMKTKDERRVKWPNRWCSDGVQMWRKRKQTRLWCPQRRQDVAFLGQHCHTRARSLPGARCSAAIYKYTMGVFSWANSEYRLTSFMAISFKTGVARCFHHV